MKPILSKILILLPWLLLCVSGVLAATIRGSVRTGEKPLQGVLVSDGVSVTATGADGQFELDLAGDAPFVWATTPTGYVAPFKDGSPRFYLPADGRASYDFSFNAAPRAYTLIALGDPQPKTTEHMQRLKREVQPDLKRTIRGIRAAGGDAAMVVLGDVVWDSPEQAVPMRKFFAGLNIPVYPVIGNHDHLIAEKDDAASTSNFRQVFGPTYYAFNLGDSHYIVLDNIIYHGDKKYQEAVDERQGAWLEAYLKHLPAGSRVCVAMHAPFQKYWKNFVRMGYGDRLLELLQGFEVHFITGHTHINSNFEVAPGVIEHNVAQVAGNLWRAPLNNDGTPRGYALFSEGDKGYQWVYKTLGKSLDHQIELFAPGRSQEHPGDVIAKIWSWDPTWTVKYMVDGRPMGNLPRFETMTDPDYTAYIPVFETTTREKLTKRLKNAMAPRRAFFYFGTTPPRDAQSIQVVATDRFGNRYTQTLNLKN